MTKIIFMGTPGFSVPILNGLVAEGYDVLRVVTQPDRPVGRKKVLTPPPVKEAALEHGIKVLQPEKISGSPEMEEIISLNPDLIVTAAFGQFLPETLLKAPKLGAINVHASLLPKYRGGAPVHYSIIKGDSETGVTIMRMVKKMDAGDMLSQKAIPISKTDDVGSMFDKLSLLGKDMLLEMLPEFIAGNIKEIPQDETLVTYSPNITREEEQIDWNKTSELIDCQVRGMRPWPVAFTTYQETRVKLWDTTPLDETTTKAPGTIIKINKKNFLVACGEGTVLQINDLQPAGKGRLKAVEYLNGVGRTMEEGHIFE
ncbi:methionyl-tRNA formyltransferase [Vagococcus fluvialis]|uniref:Methionyl-tRNA formyltransferase n=2 Tax=Bacilli TaxID=91061 RepID=A0A369AZS1_9ENTE|nr:methionyl-tRNA formyltransferase [Vagococcus fluvialis]MDT2780611.1 methionyl-tRNA formyltransferase [Vagococcus fluvialis]RCX14651.1 methionyl-tRNA formyltransferase [Vagococcus fluvialis]RSU03845.1 methionyl-tRNA formyltransferase [Vagococcus fluvialis]WNF90460.1 methionyl-tRNA formyltransferase [Vagococcus fluvialis]